MCLPYRHRDPRSRATMIAANLSLVAGVLLLDFARRCIGPTPGWLDVLTGLFMGFSIAASLLVSSRARSCASCAGRVRSEPVGAQPSILNPA